MDSADLPSLPRLRITPEDARRVGVPDGHLSAPALSHGTMEVRWYQPQDTDPQTPHDRDELYVVVSGTALFIRADESLPFADTAIRVGGEEKVSVQPGDVLFVPAGTEHRFEAMSPDFGTWMMFWGPEGGER